jgi:hypothetical protein
MNALWTLGAISFCMFVSGIASAQPQQDAPLGLTWGTSSTEVRSQGVELTETSGTTFGRSLTAKNLEKAISDQEMALLSFGFNDKLWRVLIVSRQFDNDPHGNNVLARYADLANLLSEKYGKPQQFHHLGESSFYKKSENFIWGIHQGETHWYTNFESAALFVQLGLTSEGNATSHWRLIYENKALRKEFEAAKRTREKGSL